MNKEMKDKLFEMREHVYEAGSTYTEILLSEDFYSLSIPDMKGLAIA